MINVKQDKNIGFMNDIDIGCQKQGHNLKIKFYLWLSVSYSN
jgi:hypothetical protein